MASGGWRVRKAPPGGRAAEKRNSRSARPSRPLLLPPGIVVKLVRQRHASQSAQFVAAWSIRSQRNCMSEEQTGGSGFKRSEEHTSELQSLAYLVCRLLLEKKKDRPNSRRQLPAA